MKTNHKKPAFSFTKPAVYKVRVQGDLKDHWSDRLGGMQINVDRSDNQHPISVLIGQINDQSALSGILNKLYDLHLPILSVNILKDEDQ